MEIKTQEKSSRNLQLKNWCSDVSQKRSTRAGDRTVELHNLAEYPLSPKDERIISANPPPNAAISRASRNTKDIPATSETNGSLTTTYPFSSYKPQDQNYYFGGLENGSVIGTMPTTCKPYLRQCTTKIRPSSSLRAMALTLRWHMDSFPHCLAFCRQ